MMPGMSHNPDDSIIFVPAPEGAFPGGKIPAMRSPAIMTSAFRMLSSLMSSALRITVLFSAFSCMIRRSGDCPGRLPEDTDNFHTENTPHGFAEDASRHF